MACRSHRPEGVLNSAGPATHARVLIGRAAATAVTLSPAPAGGHGGMLVQDRRVTHPWPETTPGYVHRRHRGAIGTVPPCNSVLRLPVRPGMGANATSESHLSPAGVGGTATSPRHFDHIFQLPADSNERFEIPLSVWTPCICYGEGDGWPSSATGLPPHRGALDGYSYKATTSSLPSAAACPTLHQVPGRS